MVTCKNKLACIVFGGGQCVTCVYILINTKAYSVMPWIEMQYPKQYRFCAMLTYNESTCKQGH